ncbi:hypothetical protein BDZ90DRAFT_273341 [Jaminaea rosea]|uniref:Uncharacterized protein n=1 Tax=Jaminaea rosea TaxID=1569628 RepID=A0A316UZB3_9BASI|nr:hypothetical protein BDZ90DRAFT_273341 [Jaminaea rosea]PWN29263.1 hypothetical protein BDZ90DRAFT_273341 [Jaminaea rosea]
MDAMPPLINERGETRRYTRLGDGRRLAFAKSATMTPSPSSSDDEFAHRSGTSQNASRRRPRASSSSSSSGSSKPPQRKQATDQSLPQQDVASIARAASVASAASAASVAGVASDASDASDEGEDAKIDGLNASTTRVLREKPWEKSTVPPSVKLPKAMDQLCPPEMKEAVRWARWNEDGEACLDPRRYEFVFKATDGSVLWARGCGLCEPDEVCKVAGNKPCAKCAIKSKSCSAGLDLSNKLTLAFIVWLINHLVAINDGVASYAAIGVEGLKKTFTNKTGLQPTKQGARKAAKEGINDGSGFTNPFKKPVPRSTYSQRARAEEVQEIYWAERTAFAMAHYLRNLRHAAGMQHRRLYGQWPQLDDPEPDEPHGRQPTLWAEDLFAGEDEEEEGEGGEVRSEQDGGGDDEDGSEVGGCSKEDLRRADPRGEGQKRWAKIQAHRSKAAKGKTKPSGALIRFAPPNDKAMQPSDASASASASSRAKRPLALAIESDAFIAVDGSPHISYQTAKGQEFSRTFVGREPFSSQVVYTETTLDARLRLPSSTIIVPIANPDGVPEAAVSLGRSAVPSIWFPLFGSEERKRPRTMKQPAAAPGGEDSGHQQQGGPTGGQEGGGAAKGKGRATEGALKPAVPIDVNEAAHSYCSRHFSGKRETPMNGQCGIAAILMGLGAEPTAEKMAAFRRKLQAWIAEPKNRKELPGIAAILESDLDDIIVPDDILEQVGKGGMLPAKYWLRSSWLPPVAHMEEVVLSVLDLKHGPKASYTIAPIRINKIPMRPRIVLIYDQDKAHWELGKIGGSHDGDNDDDHDHDHDHDDAFRFPAPPLRIQHLGDKAAKYIGASYHDRLHMTLSIETRVQPGSKEADALNAICHCLAQPGIPDPNIIDVDKSAAQASKGKVAASAASAASGASGASASTSQPKATKMAALEARRKDASGSAVASGSGPASSLGAKAERPKPRPSVSSRNQEEDEEWTPASERRVTRSRSTTPGIKAPSRPTTPAPSTPAGSKSAAMRGKGE